MTDTWITSQSRGGGVRWVEFVGSSSYYDWLHRLTRDVRYAGCYLGTLDWILERQVDWQHGDWHAEILAGGRIAGGKAGIWKEPYHHGRAMIEGLNLLADA